MTPTDSAAARPAAGGEIPAAEARPGSESQGSGEALSAGAGLLLLAGVTFFWGTNWPAMKVIVAEMPIFSFRTVCLFGGGIGILAIARFSGLRVRIPRGELGPLLFVSLFNITIWHLCSAAGLLHLGAGRASIIAFTMPLWAALFATRFLGERLTVTTLAGLAVGLLGMAALLLPDWAAVTADPLGPIFMLTAAISWAIGTVGLKYFRFTLPVTALTGWQLILGGVPVALGAALLEGGFSPAALSLQAWLALIYTVLAAMIFCHWGWFKLVRNYPAVVAAISTLAIPVVGVLSSALLLGEPLGLDVLLSLALVLAALFLVLVLPMLRRRGSRPR
jgi:drug/metabolite transporter (DMT)-like permease